MPTSSPTWPSDLVANSPEMTQLVINVVGQSDSDDVDERVRLADELREELLELDIDDVRRPQADVVAGAKGSALSGPS